MRSPLDIDKVVVEGDEDIGDIREAGFDEVNVLGKFVATRVKTTRRDFNVVDNHVITSFLLAFVVGLKLVDNGVKAVKVEVEFGESVRELNEVNFALVLVGVEVKCLAVVVIVAEFVFDFD